MSDTDLSNIDIDLTGVNIARPLLPRQTVKCRIGEVKLEKPDGRGRSLVVPLTLEEPGKDTKDAVVHPGFVVTDRILLDPTGGLTQEMINERLARLQVAALKLKVPQKLDVRALIGQEVLVTFDTRPDKKDPAGETFVQDVKRYSAVK